MACRRERSVLSTRIHVASIVMGQQNNYQGTDVA